MGFYDHKPLTFNEILAIIVHSISLICLILVIYLTFRRNSLVSFFAVANIGQHISKLLRIIIFSFPMLKAPTWCCYLHAFVNYLTCGMESYIAMLFAMRLWLMITKKDRLKLWLLEHTKLLSYVMGLGIPTILAVLTVAPQLLQGKNFVIPKDAQNCMAGYRQLPWQINLTGPGTLLPPTILAILFGLHIAIVLCTVSTQNIVKDVKKFSTISYSSWIRMLWFGILFCVVVAINVGRDYKNAKNLKEHGIPEPALFNIGVGYLVTAGLGLGVLLIFGTTVEAKKKISKLIKSSFDGISSSIFTKKSSTNQSQSQRTYTNNNSFNTSFIGGPDSSLVIKTDNLSFHKGPDSALNSPKSSIISPTTIKNSSVKAKKPIDEVEASMEFTKFMKSVNKVVKDENEMMEMNNMNGGGYTRNLNPMMHDNRDHHDLNINTNYNTPPFFASNSPINNGSITPRMMIPIQKFSHQRMQSQQMQIHHQQSIPQMSTLSDDNQTLINNYKLDEESLLKNTDLDESMLRMDTSSSSINPNIGVNYNNNNNNINYVRNGTFTEEIVYPPKLSFSVKMK